ncbi:MAG: SDR family NAD(P)-dependent oxidoreductase, partial [Candidatus Nanopelagicales bacterium]
MPIQLDGANVVITGAARGIGRALAARFLAEGARVVVNDVDTAACDATANAIGAISAPGDAASAAGVAALVDRARAGLGP